MIKKAYEKLLKEDISLRERLFRIINFMGIVAMSGAVISCSLLQETPLVIGTLIFGLTVLIVTFAASIKYHKIDLAASVICVLIDLIMLPVSFFVSGGLLSGSSVWFVLGLIFVFLLFTGKLFYIFLTLTIVQFMLSYYIAYTHPSLIVPMANIPSIYIDTALAVVSVGMVIGAIIKFQILVFTRERELSEKRRKEIEEISQSKSTFFANMSHEIRTPINTIIGLNEMTLREETSDEIAENAIHIQNASKMLLALINDILDLSKIESGKMEIVPVQYETGAMFSDLVNIIWIRAHEKKLELKINIAEDIPSMLYGDEVRIKQVLVNLLTNAVKYTREGSVTLTAKCENIGVNLVRLKISVEDTGIGIRKESLEELFSSFKRVDQQKNRNVEGSGLGLSITKQLVELMGGKIQVDSIYTKGSTFTVTLTQRVIDAKPMGNMDFMLKSHNGKRERYHQSFEAPNARILVVDDNEMNRIVACKLLRDTKVHVDTAASGKECLEKTADQYYHVIFMDHMMPDMDGVETLQKLQRQQNGFCREVPVIALTANVMTGAEEIYKNFGFDSYLAKPINGSLLEATLLKYLPSELVEYRMDLEKEEKTQADVVHVVSEKPRKPICITTDCVCDLPEAWLLEYGVKSMYYYVVTDQGKFSDLSEITSDNLLQYLKDDGHHAHSEHASVEEYENFFANVLEGAEQVIHISMAKNSSDGYETAVQASRGFDHVTVVDSGHLSSGMGLFVMYAARMVREHRKAAEILEQLEAAKDQISTTFIVPSAKNLYNNGKIGKLTSIFCDVMLWHPVLRLSQSRIRFYRLQTGEVNNAYRKYIQHQLRNKKRIDTRILFVTYAGCTLKQREMFASEIQRHMQFEQIVFQKASATISSNCGIGAMGLIFALKR